MQKIRGILTGLFLLALGLVLYDYPWALTPEPHEILLKVRPTGCTCADMYVIEGKTSLIANSPFPQINRYDQIFLQMDFHLPVDSSADDYWITGQIIGHKGLVDEEPDQYPIFKVSQGKFAIFTLPGLLGILLGVLSLSAGLIWGIIYTIRRPR